MLASCGVHSPAKPPLLPGGGAGHVGWIMLKEKWCRTRRGGGGGSPRPVVLFARAGLSNFFSARIGVDSQTGLGRELSHSQLLWVGPVPGDIAEIEAYCRIFRAAEQLHTSIMSTLCNPETGECGVSYATPSEDLPELEEKVAAVLGFMLALLNRGREEVLSGRSNSMSSFQLTDDHIVEGKLPPLAVFRGEMKRCCESLQIALLNYSSRFDAGDGEIWRRLQRLRNVCYDAGFSRAAWYPCPAIFANWFPVYFSTAKEGSMEEDSEVAFWRGGQVTNEGLKWLLEKGFRTIVDLRKEGAKDEFYQSAIEEAVLGGKIDVVNLPVEVGTAPLAEQVQQFASLVSNVNRRPIYLHSQEGVNRTSAMVSRWKQFITRSSNQIALNNPHNINGKAFTNGQSDELQSIQNSVTEKIEGDAVSEVKRDSQSDLDKTLKLNDSSGEKVVSAAQMELQNGDLSFGLDSLQTSVAVHGTDDIKESSSRFYIESNPLKAQFPTCDVFSRKEMSQFFKTREVSPKFYLNLHRKKIDRSSTLGQIYGSTVQRIETHSSRSTGLMQLGISNGAPVDRDYFLSKATSVSNGRAASNGSSTSLGLDANSTNQQEGSSVSVAVEPKRSSNGGKPAKENSNKILVESAKENKRKTVINSEGGISDLVEGNMCASTTGVVRIQSRRKAEMFLVRTDGFSCTREKVTESSLAFTHPSTQQQMLMWKSPPKTVLLLKKLGQELMEEAKEVASFLYYQEKMTVLVEPDVHDIFARIPGFGFVQTFYSQDTSDLHERVDFVACLGGDGVILHASNLFRGAVPPVVSFNLGSLGFLTSHAFEGYRQDLRAVIHGNNTLDGVYITLRMRLRCEIFRNGKAMPGKVFDVLNEVVVDRGSNPYLSKIECYEHNRLITKVQGDGVIVATPTGSTAYSTAAGGSMVHPNVPCMLFTPICPHSLSFRPVILPDSAQLELKIPGDTRSNAWVSFDGKRRQQLSRGDSVRICMSQHPLPTVNKSDQTGDWFRSLIRCLNWNERLDQKAL
ncbi:probable NAD kinase 2, chloroplastic [Typha latifolia]|uniref:probable NAD kinase 2, chloroplastic n=1 Tax=Typha latifolia TaxID=4733 RepID=UPI003C2F61B3